MKSRVFILTAVLLLVVSFAVGLFMHSRQMLQVLEGPENRAPPWNITRVEQGLMWSQKQYDQAMQRLSDYEFADAHRIYTEETREPIHDYYRWYPTRLVASGLTFQAWVETRNQTYEQTLVEAFDQALAALALGQVDPKRLETALSIYTNLPALRSRYENRIEAIQKTRLAEAGRAVRLLIRGLEDARWMEVLIEKKFMALFDASSEQVLWLGEPLSAAEETATLRRMEVEATIDYASYKVSRMSSFGEVHWKPERLPAFVKLKWRFTGVADRMSSWDALESIEVLLEPPERVSAKTHDHFLYYYRKKLKEEVGKQLEELSPFNEIQTPEAFKPS